jgi:hypothetical protein
MLKFCAGLVITLLLVLPLQAQMRGGSLVVFIVSLRPDYVVIGAESHDRDLWSRKPLDNKGCKIISLAEDTLFFSTGLTEATTIRGPSWSSNRTARNVYRLGRKHDALTLANAWNDTAMAWFGQQPDGDLRGMSDRQNGELAVVGFINFDKNGKLSLQAVEISYDAVSHKPVSRTSTYGPGRIGMAGVGAEWVERFLKEKPTTIDPIRDVSFIQKAIQFALDNATEEERAALGGDIDIAVIRNDSTIQWITRKDSCYQQDKQPARPAKRTPK